MDRNSPKSSEVLSSNTNSRRSSMQPFGNRRNVQKNTNKPESKENVNVAASDTEGYQRPPSRTTVPSHYRSHTLASPLKPTDPAFQRMSTAVGADSTPRDTRIPRPKSSASIDATSPSSPGQYNRTQKQPSGLRQPMSLKAAFKRAQEQQTDDDTIDLNQAFNMANAEANRGIDGSPSPAPRSFPRGYYAGRDSRDTKSPNTQRSQRGGDLGQQLQKFDRNHQLGKTAAPLNGLFMKNRVGPKVSETGNTLARKTSSSSLGSNNSNQWNATPPRGRGGQNPLESTTPDGVPMMMNIGGQGDQGGHPIPSIELEYAASDERPTPISHPANLSPEKSFNWHLDADFTAGDLQVSNSPRVRTRKTNGGSPDNFPASSPREEGTPKWQQRSNNKLDQIREREAEIQSIPLSEDAPSPPRRNTKLDEIRAREIEALSRRAVATSRLDEIKARNFETGSESPETDRRSSKDSLREELVGLDSKPTNKDEGKAVSELQDREGKNSVTSNSNNVNSKRGDDLAKPQQDASKKEPHATHDPPSQGDSHDLLRRLARATSSSPTPPLTSDKTGERLSTAESSGYSKPEEIERSRPRSTREERKSRIQEIKSSRERPTVGFVGLKRVASSDSLQSKRGSMPTSEVDPTDRIEAEMKLFALMDNSERGSIRAPSPFTPESESADEETPRPNRIDPRTLPTPRVTGAYIETPATVRVKDEDDLSDKVASDSVLYSSRPFRRNLKLDDSKAPVTQIIKREGGNGAEKAVSATGSKARSLSAPGVRRARSACRRRCRPLINTAKPVSAKEDLRAILRRHEIDDSTLEDFEERLAKHEIDPEELDELVEETTLKVEEDANTPELTDSERELQPYVRMGKSLRTLLTDIRSAKQGIERLEDKVTHSEHIPQDHDEPKMPITQPTSSSGSAAIVISLPLLWRRNPKFKLTTFGVLSLLLAIWWPLELAFSHCYAAPQYECTTYAPCDWSPNEPHYPYAMPFMLDEWATGGKGRAWAFRIGEEMGDLAAEVSDWITNTDFTQHDERFMNVWERKRHRRRLRKHDLYLKWVQPADYQPRYTGWEAAQRASEGTHELGYDDIGDDEDDGGDESMSADESVRWW